MAIIMTIIINIIININLYESYIERRFAEIAIRVAMKTYVNQIDRYSRIRSLILFFIFNIIQMR